MKPPNYVLRTGSKRGPVVGFGHALDLLLDVAAELSAQGIRTFINTETEAGVLTPPALHAEPPPHPSGRLLGPAPGAPDRSGGSCPVCSTPWAVALDGGESLDGGGPCWVCESDREEAEA